MIKASAGSEDVKIGSLSVDRWGMTTIFIDAVDDAHGYREVYKIGMKTGLRAGYPAGWGARDEAFIVRPLAGETIFADHGDSGALCFGRTQAGTYRALGIVTSGEWAGKTGNYGVVVPMMKILAAIKKSSKIGVDLEFGP